MSNFSILLSIYQYFQCPFIYFVSIYLLIYSIYLSIFLSFYLAMYLSTNLSIYLSSHQSIYLSIYSTFLCIIGLVFEYRKLYKWSFYKYFRLFKSICLSTTYIYLSIYLKCISFCLSMYFSIYLSNFCLSIIQ